MWVSACFLPLYHLGGGKGGSLRKLKSWMLGLRINAGMRQGGGGEESRSLAGWAENAVAKGSERSGGPDHLEFQHVGGLYGILKLH